MFQINDDLSIYVTRGDVVFFTVSADEDGVPYIFKKDDVVRIKVTQRKNSKNVVLQKDFVVNEPTETVHILLKGKDTKIGDVISKPVDYWYEVELNPFSNPQTIIGYDDDGAKIFKLFPEGRDLVDEPKEELPEVDAELDLTSTRPVQNQAIASAMVKLEDDVHKVMENADRVESAAILAEKAAEEAKAQADSIKENGVAERTHWKEVISEDGVILEETPVVFKTMMMSVNGLGTNNINEGGDYIVTWNGTPYECTADDICLGNKSLILEGSEDTGEPFAIELTSATSCMIMKVTSDAETVTLKVEGKEKVVYHTLDPRYIKDMYYEEGGIVEIIAENEVEYIGTDEGVTYVQFTKKLEVQAGKKYSVFVNGEEREANCFDSSSGLGLPEGSYLALTDAETIESENFTFQIAISNCEELFAEIGYGQGVFIGEYAEGEFTVSIAGNGETVHKIQGKYLPEGTPWVERFDDVILAETTMELTSNNMMQVGISELEEGVVYNVTWNGVKYECVAEALPYSTVASIGIGNCSIFGGESTDHPFGFAKMNNGGLYAVVSTESGEMTFSIIGGTKFHKIDERCESATTPFMFEVTLDSSSNEVWTEGDMSEVEKSIKRAIREGRIVVAVNSYDEHRKQYYYLIGVTGNYLCFEGGYGTHLDDKLITRLKWNMGFATCSYSQFSYIEQGKTYITLTSSTRGSTKKFNISVDDSGTIKATEVTE